MTFPGVTGTERSPRLAMAVAAALVLLALQTMKPMAPATSRRMTIHRKLPDWPEAGWPGGWRRLPCRNRQGGIRRAGFGGARWRPVVWRAVKHGRVLRSGRCVNLLHSRESSCFGVWWPVIAGGPCRVRRPPGGWPSGEGSPDGPFLSEDSRIINSLIRAAALAYWVKPPGGTNSSGRRNVKADVGKIHRDLAVPGSPCGRAPETGSNRRRAIRSIWRWNRRSSAAVFSMRWQAWPLACSATGSLFSGVTSGDPGAERKSGRNPGAPRSPHSRAGRRCPK